PFRVGFEHELGHLVLMSRKVRTLVELQDQAADLLAPLADLELAGAGLLGRLRVLREQGDVTVGVAGIERPAVAGVEFVDLGPVLGAGSSHVCLHGWGGGSGSSCRSAAGRDSGRAPRPAQLTSLPAHPMVAGMTQGLYSAIAARWAEAPGADAIIEDS